MRYEFEGKKITIPDDEIKKNMEVLDISQEEAIQIWLEDNEYLHNEEQEELCKKAKDNHIMATIHDTKKKPRATTVERERKANPTKELIIAAMAQSLTTLGVEDLKVENIGKLITFRLHNEEFKLDLVQKRKKKE